MKISPLRRRKTSFRKNENFSSKVRRLYETDGLGSRKIEMSTDLVFLGKLCEYLNTLKLQERKAFEQQILDMMGNTNGDNSVDEVSIPKKDAPKKASAKGASKSKGSAKYAVVDDVTDKRDVAIFMKLKAWRKKVASDLGIQLWDILNNKPLVNIAYHKPKSREDLLRVVGIGPEKLDKYGDTILQILSEFEKPGKSGGKNLGTETAVEDGQDFEYAENVISTTRKLRANK